jgi:hypothetical protein
MANAECRTLTFGIWHLAFGIRHLPFGICHSAFHETANLVLAREARIMRATMRA